MSPEPCPHCKRPDNPAITNWVTGHVFVGWGHGWQPCSMCGGSTIDPKFEAAVTWLVELLKQLVLQAALDQGRRALDQGAMLYAEVRRCLLAQNAYYDERSKCSSEDPDYCSSSRCTERQKMFREAWDKSKKTLHQMVDVPEWK